MASPTDAGRAGTTGTATTSPVINLPASIAAGDTLLVFIRNGAGGTITALNEGTDWIQLFEDTSDASNDTTALFWRKANGSEGSTVTFAFGTSGKWASVAYRITGAADPTVTAPESQLAIGTGNADSPSITPSGGSKDYLFIALAGQDGTGGIGQGVTLSQTYTNLVTGGPTSGGSAATNCAVAGCSRQLTASTEDPAIWANSPSNGWTAATVAIYPAPAGGGPVVPIMEMHLTRMVV